MRSAHTRQASVLVRRASVRKASVGLLAMATLVMLGLSGCSGLHLRQASYEIAGGDPAGVYYAYGDQLAEAAQRELGLKIAVATTQGSVENLQRVATGRSIVGFAQGDTAVDAIHGEGDFAEPLPIQAVARVYDEYVHVVVRESSSAETIADLAGKRISLGSQSSGVQVIAARVLNAAGIGPGAVSNAALGLDESIAAMINGDIEGFFWVGGLPTPGIESLKKAMPIRMLPIDAATVELVNEGHAGVYQLADFPVGAYDLAQPVVTMTVPNYLLTSESAPEAVINDLVRVLFDARSSISRSVPAAEYLDRRQAIFTSPIELHPGSARYFIESRY